jgi:hypothetical protein
MELASGGRPAQPFAPHAVMSAKATQARRRPANRRAAILTFRTASSQRPRAAARVPSFPGIRFSLHFRGEFVERAGQHGLRVHREFRLL